MGTGIFPPGFFHEARPRAIFPTEMHSGVPTGTVSTRSNPVNQTRSEGKNPQGPIPTEILRISYKSKEALGLNAKPA
jgi:hypothetical protein